MLNEFIALMLSCAIIGLRTIEVCLDYSYISKKINRYLSKVPSSIVP